MCNCICYSHGGRTVRIRFSDPTAVLPVKSRAGAVTLLPWGRRQIQKGALPLGGWARLDAIHAGHWDRWFPVPVKLAVDGFAERDIEDRYHWYELTRGQWVQGLVARDHHERRVYVVTVIPELEDAIHERWPRILSG